MRRFGAAFVNNLFEIWRTDLFFKLPKETDVDRNVRLDRRARAKQCAERGSFVVSGAAAVVSVAFFREHKRLGVPRLGFFRGGLNVDVVVDRDGRQVVVVAKHAMNDGISLFSPVNFDFSAITLDCFDGELDAFSDVFQRDSDRRRPSEFQQNAAAASSNSSRCELCKRQKIIPFQCCGHSRSSVELSCGKLGSHNKANGAPIQIPDNGILEIALTPLLCLRSDCGRPKPHGRHLHAYGDFAENFVRRPAYIQKRCCFVLFWRPRVSDRNPAPRRQ